MATIFDEALDETASPASVSGDAAPTVFHEAVAPKNTAFHEALAEPKTVFHEAVNQPSIPEFDPSATPPAGVVPISGAAPVVVQHVPMPGYDKRVTAAVGDKLPDQPTVNQNLTVAPPVHPPGRTEAQAMEQASRRVNVNLPGDIRYAGTQVIQTSTGDSRAPTIIGRLDDPQNIKPIIPFSPEQRAEIQQRSQQHIAQHGDIQVARNAQAFEQYLGSMPRVDVNAPEDVYGLPGSSHDTTPGKQFQAAELHRFVQANPPPMHLLEGMPPQQAAEFQNRLHQNLAPTGNLKYAGTEQVGAEAGKAPARGQAIGAYLLDFFNIKTNRERQQQQEQEKVKSLYGSDASNEMMRANPTTAQQLRDSAQKTFEKFNGTPADMAAKAIEFGSSTAPMFIPYIGPVLGGLDIAGQAQISARNALLAQNPHADLEDVNTKAMLNATAKGAVGTLAAYVGLGGKGLGGVGKAGLTGAAIGTANQAIDHAMLGAPIDGKEILDSAAQFMLMHAAFHPVSTIGGAVEAAGELAGAGKTVIEAAKAGPHLAPDRAAAKEFAKRYPPEEGGATPSEAETKAAEFQPKPEQPKPGPSAEDHAATEEENRLVKKKLTAQKAQKAMEELNQEQQQTDLENEEAERRVRMQGPYKTYGWKLHLATDDPEAVSDYLRKQGIPHKVGRNAEQTGKDVTVYVGDRRLAEKTSQDIEAAIGDKLKAPEGDALANDRQFTPKVMGRFDIEHQAPEFHQYGAKGIPLLKEDQQAALYDKERFNQEESLKRSHGQLQKKFGDFYEPQPTVFHEAVAGEKHALQKLGPGGEVSFDAGQGPNLPESGEGVRRGEQGNAPAASGGRPQTAGENGGEKTQSPEESASPVARINEQPSTKQPKGISNESATPNGPEARGDNSQTQAQEENAVRQGQEKKSPQATPASDANDAGVLKREALPDEQPGWSSELKQLYGRIHEVESAQSFEAASKSGERLRAKSAKLREQFSKELDKFNAQESARPKPETPKWNPQLAAQEKAAGEEPKAASEPLKKGDTVTFPDPADPQSKLSGTIDRIGKDIAFVKDEQGTSRRVSVADLMRARSGMAINPVTAAVETGKAIAAGVKKTIDIGKTVAKSLHDYFTIDPVPKLAREGVSDEAVEHASARIATPHMVNDLLSKVFPDTYHDPKKMAPAVNVLNADNILGIHDQFKETAEDSRSKAQNLLATVKDLKQKYRELRDNPPADTEPEMIADQKRKLTRFIRYTEQKARGLVRESVAAKRAASNIEQAHDLQFLNGTVLDGLKDPEIAGAIDRWKQHVNPLLDQLYNEVKRVDPNTEREGRGRHTGARINLVSEEAAAKWQEAMTDSSKPLPESRAASYRNPDVKQDRFMQRAKGTGDYGSDAKAVLTAVLGPRWNEATKIRLVEALKAKGLAVETGGPPRKGQKQTPIPTEIQGQPAARLPIKLPVTSKNDVTTRVEKQVYVRGDLVRELRNVLDTDLRPRLNSVGRVLNGIQLAQAADAITHAHNIASVIANAQGAGAAWKDVLRKFPGMNVADATVRVGRVAKEIYEDGPAIRDEIAKMAQAGNIRPHYPSTGLSKITHVQDGLHMLDTAARVTMNRFYDDLVARKLAPDTVEGRRDYINQIGQYNGRLMSTWTRLIKESGASPFLTAGRNFNRQGRRLLTGNPGFEATSNMAALKLRAMNLLGTGLVATVPMMLNSITTGTPMGRSGTAVGQWDLGTDEKDGKHKVIDLMQLSGQRRGLRATGIGAALEGIQQGKDLNSTIGNMFRDIGNSAIHPFVGPAVSFAETLRSGKSADFSQIPLAQQYPGGKQYLENLRAAVKGANSLIYAGLRPGFRKMGLDEEPDKEDQGFWATAAKPFLSAAGVKNVRRGTSAAEDMASNFANSSTARAAMTPENAQKAQAHKQIVEQLRKNPEEGDAALNSAIEDGTINEATAALLRKKAGMESFEWNLRGLSGDKAAQVYEAATTAEKGRIKDQVLKKLTRPGEMAADEQDRLMNKLGLEPPIDLGISRELHTLNKKVGDWNKVKHEAMSLARQAEASPTPEVADYLKQKARKMLLDARPSPEDTERQKRLDLIHKAIERIRERVKEQSLDSSRGDDLIKKLVGLADKKKQAA